MEHLKNKNLIKKIFEECKIKNKELIFSCGSGISACVLSLSLMHGLNIKRFSLRWFMGRMG